MTTIVIAVAAAVMAMLVVSIVAVSTTFVVQTKALMKVQEEEQVTGSNVARLIMVKVKNLESILPCAVQIQHMYAKRLLAKNSII